MVHDFVDESSKEDTMDFVKIGSWSTPRAVGVRRSDGKLVLQVRSLMCLECETCVKRSRYVQERLKLKGVTAAWSPDESIVALPDPKLNTTEEKLGFLSDLLGLPVFFVDWHVST